MRERGRLTDWNDERGFGFITPLEGDVRVFAHVSEFPRDLRRPMVTDLLTYDVAHDDRGRLQAHTIAFMVPAHVLHEETHRLGVFELAVLSLFAIAMLVLTAARAIPPIVLGFYVAASVIAFAMYWHDKAAAMHGKWRVSESSLLMIAVVGGWPGAYLARHVLRHKTRKQPFRTYFWLAVGLNLVLLTVIVVELSRTPR